MAAPFLLSALLRAVIVYAEPIWLQLRFWCQLQFASYLFAIPRRRGSFRVAAAPIISFAVRAHFFVTLMDRPWRHLSVADAHGITAAASWPFLIRRGGQKQVPFRDVQKLL